MPKISELFSAKIASYRQSSLAESKGQKQLTVISDNTPDSSNTTIGNNEISNNTKSDNYIKSNISTATLEEQSYQEIGKAQILNKQSTKDIENKKSKTDKTKTVQSNKKNSVSADGTKVSADGTKKTYTQEEKAVDDLKKVDRDVKAHESAHRSAGGGLVRGGTTFSFVIGPDGKQYAVGGEVKIDMSYDLNHPEETIRKMQQVEQAALAPSDPSAQDRAVASKAASIESEARAEMQKQRTDNISKTTKGSHYISKIYDQSKQYFDKKIGERLNVVNSSSGNI
jgi:hypothetical protein